MEVSSQDPSLVAMDLSKTYKPLTRSHAEAMDLVKKPEWYHRRPASCSADITMSSFRSRASSSSYNALSSAAGAPVHCRDADQRPEALTTYMNSSITPGLDLYRDGVHSNLWHPGFYGPDRSGTAAPESSGAEESDSGSDVIFLVSSAKEPLLCSPFVQDGVRPIVEPLSPAASSLDRGRGCCHLPQPLSSPSADSSYSDDSSDSSVDIPIHHTRPVVLLSDLSSVYRNPAESLDVSSEDSDVIEVSVTNTRKNTFSHKKTLPRKKSDARQSSPQSERAKAPAIEVRRSSRIRKPVSETLQFSCTMSRYSLRRQAKNDAVGIYNESCDSDDMMEYAARLSSPDVDESHPKPNKSQRASSSSHESDLEVRTEKTSPLPRGKPTSLAKRPLTDHKRRRVRGTKQKQQNHEVSSVSKKNATRRKKKRRTCAGPPALFPPREPEIKLKYVKLKEEKKAKKSNGFCPFVHVEHRTCTVVNSEEEEVTVRSSRGTWTQTGAKSLPGCLPNTSCFQLGRLRSESKSQGALSCSLCGQVANMMGLGDLHGPYCRGSSCVDVQSCRTEQKEGDDSHGHTNSHSVHSSNGSCDSRECSPAVGHLLDGDSGSLPKIPLQLDECWIHEDCGIWSAGVFLVRGKLYGLEEAARLARETVCSACGQTGAIMGCFQKGCSRSFHYTCAIHSGGALNEENFSMRCTEHKNKTVSSVTRRHKR